MEIGDRYVVYVHIDEESYRIVASAKVERFLKDDAAKAGLKRNQEVDILIWQKTDLGFKAIVNNQYPGLIYQNQIYKYVHTGDRMKAMSAMCVPTESLIWLCNLWEWQQRKISLPCCCNILKIIMAIVF